ncbi:hypothetical protein [Bdellovibrio sp. HCB337]|uniref:hypothetical protein n=1 Tax=Bdellovibrio sp. HCB337 TaxID=3394358 RepID=UPI0039A7364D
MMSWILLLSQVVFASPVLEGSFVRSCYLVGDDALQAQVQVHSGSWIQTFTAYEEETCQTPYLIYEVQSAADIHGNDVDLEVREVSYQSLSDEVTRALNMVNYCGFTNWKTKQKRVVTGLECDEFQAPRLGEKTYTRYQLSAKAGSSEQLLLGTAEGVQDGKTPNTRHHAFETLPYQRIP